MITVPLYIIILTISPHYIIYFIVSTVYHHDQSMYTVIGYHHNYIVPLYSTHCIHSMPSCLMLHHSLGMSHCYHWRLRRSDAALFRGLGWAKASRTPRWSSWFTAPRTRRAVAPGGCTGRLHRAKWMVSTQFLLWKKNNHSNVWWMVSKSCDFSGNLGI
jgi:hypothetical protein